MTCMCSLTWSYSACTPELGHGMARHSTVQAGCVVGCTRAVPCHSAASWRNTPAACSPQQSNSPFYYSPLLHLQAVRRAAGSRGHGLRHGAPPGRKQEKAVVCSRLCSWRGMAGSVRFTGQYKCAEGGAARWVVHRARKHGQGFEARHHDRVGLEGRIEDQSVCCAVE